MKKLFSTEARWENLGGWWRRINTPFFTLEVYEFGWAIKNPESRKKCIRPSIRGNAIYWYGYEFSFWRRGLDSDD